MCGILGTIGCGFSENELRLIAHRGPDSWGVEERALNGKKIQLGHTRLAIVELSDAGAQPLVSKCGNYIITFNGEIYNHLKLRKRLKFSNFNGHSDTETILYYLIENGISGVKDFNGIFSFSFLNIKDEKLYLVRDHFGVKPLYYYCNSRKIIFSSEIRPIKLLTNPELNKGNFATLLRLRYLPSPETLYSGIKKLNPGSFLKIDLSIDILETEQNYFINKLPKVSFQSKIQAVKNYAKKIEGAVHRQLMSDVEVGVLLSGGIDSAVIASLAQKKIGKPLKAFTIGFEGLHDEDEVLQAQKTADVLGLDHFAKRISFDDFLSVLKESNRIIEEPLATTSVIPMYYLAEFASEYVKVVLTGQGADEPLGGYQRYQGEIISSMIPRELIKMSERFVNLPFIKNEKIIRALDSLGEKDNITRFLKVYSVFSPQEIKELLGFKEEKALNIIRNYYEILGCAKRKASVDKMMAIDTRMNLSDDLLLYTDKITMNFALECRVPMLDQEFVNYIESLPSKYRVQRGKTKIIHKKYAERLLPTEIINRKKFGFQSPTNIWFKEYNDKIKNLLLNKSIFTDIFDSNAIENVLKQHLKGYNREKQIFLLLSIYFWLVENYKYKNEK